MTAMAAPHVPEASFGLTKGTKWTYSLKSGSGAKIVLTHQVKDMVKVNGIEVAEIEVIHPEYSRFQYRGTSGGGLYDYENLYLGHMRGVNEESTPAPLLAPGIKAGAEWNWVEQKAFQTGGRVTPQQMEEMRRKLTLSWHAEVEAVDKDITTPAGTFKALLVRYDAVSEQYGHQTVRRWISPEAGLLKEESGAGEKMTILELTAFSKGS